MGSSAYHWTELKISLLVNAMSASNVYIRKVLLHKFSSSSSDVGCLRRYSSGYFARLSQLFQPSDVGSNPKKAENAAQLVVRRGMVQPCSSGQYAVLPLFQRSLNKLCRLVDQQMAAVAAQRITLPTLTPKHLWKKSGRLEKAGAELMTMQDRHNISYILSPTHEEAVCDLLSSSCPLGVPVSRLPLRLYQITPKFRDEARPRHALIRSREFLMKDLYTFDADEAAATDTYKAVSEAYNTIFSKIGVPFIRASGSCGAVGGQYSHEFHYLSSAAGQDEVLSCSSCHYSATAALLAETRATQGDDQQQEQQPSTAPCPDCGNGMTAAVGVEVGHTFLLGSSYSAPLNVVYRDSVKGPQPLVMGCYGLGLTRIIQAALEVTCANQADDSIVWPWSLAPYRVCIIGPKHGSKEKAAAQWVEFLASSIEQQVQSLRDNIIIDDRDKLTIGARVMDAQKTGYPIILVAGKAALQDLPQFELIDNTEAFRQLTNCEDVPLWAENKQQKGSRLLTQLQLLNTLSELCNVLER